MDEHTDPNRIVEKLRIKNWDQILKKIDTRNIF